MDFLTLERSKGGFQHILVITDHFTRFAQAVPTRNMTAKTTAEALFNNFITFYGIPTRLHSDQGANFVGNIIKELCNITGMTKSRTTPYHAMGNGMTERFNRTLLDMLGTLEPQQKSNWKPHVAPLVHAYNCTRHESTGHSPYYLLFGREPRLPVDLAFGINEQQQKSLTKYVEELRDRMKKAYEVATASAQQARSRQKENYDYRIRGSNIKEGDRVLVKVVAFDGKHKIADRWENDTYIIVKQPNPMIPVFVVKKENGEGKKRTLHRNLLLPIGYLEPSDTKRPIPAPRKQSQPITPSEKEKQQTDVIDSENDNDTDDEEVPVPQTVESFIPHDELDSTTELEYNQIEDVEDAQQVDSTDTEIRDQHSSADRVGMSHSGDNVDISGNTDGVPDNEEADVSQDDDNEYPRRSTRNRSQPAWMSSGDFIVNTIQRGKNGDWKEKVQYLQSLITTGSCKGFEEKVIDTMLSIIKE
ncbi:hypothetical protein FSP39_019394 [Pinctada imbricata]|uniref:Integrase catalytic domain-containing protein n=1 Tax=Pinctada imbricata TaxID=66713 RepID=A0AA88XPX1_PINIB|nr:hypothetical protein FSP39_019394 [Pinctada imbricata]